LTPSKWLGAIPVPAFIGCFAVLYALNIETTFEPPYLAFILNTLFITLASFIVAYVSAWSYLLSSSRTLNLMGAAVLMFGLSISLGGLLVTVNVNAALAVFNVCALVSGILQTITALVRSSTSETPSKPRRVQLTITYVGAVGVVALVTIASLSGNVPAFVVPGGGFTILRQAIIGMATVLFGLSSILFMGVYSKSRTPILYWYSLALAMTAVGLLGVTIAKVDTPLGWTGRIALCSGGIYFLIAVLTTRRARIREA
jgi:hypothetical protein